MLLAAALFFQVAAVASWARSARPKHLLFGALAAGATLLICIREYGRLPGALLAVSMTMAVASSLVLAIAPRPALARFVALGAATLALVLAGWSWRSS